VPIIKAAILLLLSTAVVAQQSHSLAHWVPTSAATHNTSLTPVADNPLIYSSTYALAATATDPEPNPSKPRRKRNQRWLPWVIAGGILLLLFGAAASGDSSASSGGLADAEAGGADGGGATAGDGGMTDAGGTGGATDGSGAPPLTQDSPTSPEQTTDGAVPSTTIPQDRSEPFRPQQGVFFSLGSSRLNKRATEQSRAAESGTEFLSLGYDRLLRENLNAGLLLDLSRSDTTTNNSRGSRNNRANTVFAFADYQMRATTRFSAYVGVATATDDNVRFANDQDVQVVNNDSGMGAAELGGSAQINSDSRSNDTLLGFSVTQELSNRRALQSELRLNVDYSRRRFNGFRESGNTSLELIFPERLQDSLTARLGFGLTRSISTQRGVLVPQFGLDWVHESRNKSQRIVATLASDPTLNSISNTDVPDTGYGSANAGLSLVAPNGLQLYMAYEKLFEHDFRETDTLSIGARLEL